MRRYLPMIQEAPTPENDLKVSQSSLGMYVSIGGRADRSLAPSLQSFLDEAASSDMSERPLVLDFRKVIALDSTFMGMIATVACQRAKAKQGPVILIRVNATMRRTITGVGLAKVVTLHENPPPELAELISQPVFPLTHEGARKKASRNLVIEAHESLADLAEGPQSEEFKTIADLCRKTGDRRNGTSGDPADS